MISGLLVLILSAFGIVADKDQLAFVVFAILNVGIGAYSFYQRFKKGDLTLGGIRK
jgi:hypothetical protein